MTTFISRDPGLNVGHATIDQAAGSVTIVRFRAKDGVGIFETDSEPVAAALQALIDSGKLPDVKRLDPPEKPAPADKPAKK